jgi:serine/threonine-protein kinase
MGVVYEVEDTTIGKHYVVKVLHAHLDDRAELTRRLELEAKTLAKLAHPNIVEIVTAGVTRDELALPFFVMERLNGRILREILDRKGALAPAHALPIAIDLLEALAHAHGFGVVHRDVKPENIFLHRGLVGGTRAKLLDFGILGFIEQSLGGKAGVTVRYASPEQLIGTPPTPASDIYGAGLVLYEMVAGRGPYDDIVEVEALVCAHLEKPAPTLDAMIPATLWTWIRAALEKDPRKRPPDAATFAEGLRAVAVALDEPAATPFSWPPPKSHR